MIPYLVCEFSKPTLSNLVKECFGADFPDIFKKPQLNYIFQYLYDLGANSVLLEREYLDKDYLEDFSRYYVKCFKNGGQKCARLHFFSSKIDHTSFTEILKNGSESDDYAKLSDSYLGFVIIKPLHQTFIGKTCLKLYSSIEENENKACLTREYCVNLFGVELKVTSTAFQEQDKVVSACATTAIWTALHGSAEKQEKLIPSCSEITTNAINHIDGSNNSFPNDGLTNKQILRALDVEGLRYHNIPIDKENSDGLFDIVKYHIDSNIPLILGVNITNPDPKLSGGHAITILGYANGDSGKAFYVHDDRLGPFARASVLEESGNLKLALQIRDADGNWLSPHEYLIPSSLIIPTNKKVRIPYKHPKNTCTLIYDFVTTWLNSPEGSKTDFNISNISHSLKLYSISDIRKYVLDFEYGDQQQNLENLLDRKTLFLTRSYARFQWVASFTLNGNKAFKILFDATDIPQGDAVSGIFIEHHGNAKFILDIIKKYSGHVKTENRKLSESFINSLVKHLKDPDADYFTYLDENFGELRAPRYIHKHECSGGDISSNPSKKIFYEPASESLETIFPLSTEDKPLIWAITSDGALIIGEDKGHPTLTGFKPARIAGELKKASDGWSINSKSGRYSKDYYNSDFFLNNAYKKFKSFFPDSSASLQIESIVY